MVSAVCIKCGSLKRGALARCADCFHLPRTEEDLVASLALTDRHYSEDELRRIGAAIAAGEPPPIIAAEHDSRLRSSARGYHAAYSHVIERLENSHPHESANAGPEGEPVRGRFSEAEWELVRTLPLQVFGFIAGADGRIDREEINDLIGQIAIWQHLQSPLHREILQTFADETDFWHLLQHANSYADSLDKCREIKAILQRALSPAEYHEFMRSLFWSGLEIAQSSGGGPFGLLDTVGRAERKHLDVFADLYDIDLGSGPPDP